MKNLLITLIFSICTIAQVFAINSIPQKPCDILTLTDGRSLEVKITKVTDDRVLFVSCNDNKNEIERVYHTKFISSIYLSNSLKTIDLSKDLQFSKYPNKSKNKVKYSKRAKRVMTPLLIIGGSIITAVVVGIHAFYKAIMNYCFMC